MAKKKEVPASALSRAGGIRIPITNTSGTHSFVVSLVYFEDEGPVGRWSSDGGRLCRVLDYLGNQQRNPLATTPDTNNHYQKSIDRLDARAQDWLRNRPAVDQVRDYLCSFRVTGRHRIWGILTDFVFYLLWDDPNHEVYPVAKA